MTKALLALEDGKYFEGESFGAEGESTGEVVFNTSMTGYQEILTDPSYKGQMVLMTYPEIGNYGVNMDDVESRKPYVEGFIVREGSRIHSNWRSVKSLHDYLYENGVTGIQGIDTRALTRHLRNHGSKIGIISTVDLNSDSLVERAKNVPSIIGRDIVQEVAYTEEFVWRDKRIRNYVDIDKSTIKEKKYSVAVIDCGVKFNILRQLSDYDCALTIYPPKVTAEEIFNNNHDGVFYSNGPGDPEGVPYVIENARKLIGNIPIFGICLGHQILALALNATTYKLKFGHHGGNHPVKNLATGSIEITAQNHNFCVEPETMKKSGLELTHINLYDNTCEGMKYPGKFMFTVQYHPEASPGPHDSRYLFKEFTRLMDEFKKK
ncbi:glutamine-hydrolyzing carbamoyl-phosphate synthase small subunit [candidate division KSB1 bacterium]